MMPRFEIGIFQLVSYSTVPFFAQCYCCCLQALLQEGGKEQGQSKEGFLLPAFIIIWLSLLGQNHGEPGAVQEVAGPAFDGFNMVLLHCSPSPPSKSATTATATHAARVLRAHIELSNMIHCSSSPRSSFKNTFFTTTTSPLLLCLAFFFFLLTHAMQWLQLSRTSQFEALISYL